MKKWLIALVCFVLATSAFAQLSVLVGPSALADRQNAIFGAALGVNATLWGPVPGRPNLGVVGIIDAVYYLGSTSDAYDFDDRNNVFGFNVCTGAGYVFTLSREIRVVTYAKGGPLSDDELIRVFDMGIGGKYPYSEGFDIVQAVDESNVLVFWDRDEGSPQLAETRVQYVPVTRERSLHAGLGLNLNISPIYDTADQNRAGFFIGVGGTLMYVSHLKPGYYDVRVVGITDGVIVYDKVERLWYPEGRPRIVELTFFYDIFDLFGIDEPGYQFNYDNKFGLLFSVSLWGRDMAHHDGKTGIVDGILIPLGKTPR